MLTTAMSNVLSGVVVVVLLGGALSLAEWIDPADRRGPRRVRGTRIDAAWFLVHMSYAPLTGIGVLAAVAALAHHGFAHSLVVRSPAAAQLAGAVVLADLAAYWLHRAMHTARGLWWLHAVHHGATDLHWWSAFRFHPLDGMLASTVPLLAVAACGLGVGAVAGYVAIVFVVTLFAHADVWVPGPALARIVATPAFHRTHHEIGRTAANFAVVLPIWDRLFGTLADRAETAPIAQWSSARPISNDATLAMQLTAIAAAPPESRPRHTNAASR